MSERALEYRVHPSVFQAHPGYRRGVVVVRDADSTAGGAALRALLRTEEDGVRARLDA